MPKKLSTEVFISRAIIKHGEGKYDYSQVVYVNGTPTDESYVKHHDRYTLRPNNIFPEVPFTVPENKYFMLGDNRSNSQDSRYWGFASLDDMRGPVFFRYWPLNRIGIPK